MEVRRTEFVHSLMRVTEGSTLRDQHPRHQVQKNAIEGAEKRCAIFVFVAEECGSVNYTTAAKRGSCLFSIEMGVGKGFRCAKTDRLSPVG